MKPSDENIGQRFQEESKLVGGTLPAPTKKITVTKLEQMITLPPPVKKGGAPLWETQSRRVSDRSYTREPLTLAQLSQLLWTTQGKRNGFYRLCPSAGACYPMDTYLVVNRVTDIVAGFYLYQPTSHQIQLLSSGDYSTQITTACLNQAVVARAAVIFIWVASLSRIYPKYHQRAYRYIYLEGGHICQNLSLTAKALELGCCAIGAFADDILNTLIGIDGKEKMAIYLAAVGKIDVIERMRQFAKETKKELLSF